MSNDSNSTLVKTPPKHVSEFIVKPDLLPIAKLLKLSAEERLEHAAYGDKLELAGVLYRGFALMGLKEELGHGEYRGGLAARGISKDAAVRSVNLAKLSTRVSEANFAASRHLPPYKLLLLVSWTDDELNDFFKMNEVNGITLENMQVNSIKELESQIKQNRNESNELQQSLNNEVMRRETAEMQLNNLQKALDYVPEADMHYVATEIMEESAVFAQQAINAVDNFSTLFDTFNNNRDDIAMDFPAQEQATAATLVVHLKAIHAKLSMAMQQHADRFGPVAISEEDQPLMSLDEARKVMSMRKILLRDQEIDEAHRKSLREEKQKQRKKPGPKMGSSRSKVSA